jgi:hypothetical protein
MVVALTVNISGLEPETFPLIAQFLRESTIISRLEQVQSANTVTH